MPSKQSIGKVTCPCCGAIADVRTSKSGFAFVFCDADCNLQIFTRNKYQHEKLTARMTALKIAEPEKQVEPEKQTEPPQKYKIGLLIS